MFGFRKIFVIPLRNYLLPALFLALAMPAFVFLLRDSLPPQVPLFYGQAEGETQLAPWWMLTLPSFTSVSISLLNFILAVFVSDEFLKKVLLVTSVACAFFAIITTVKIIFLVGSF